MYSLVKLTVKYLRYRITAHNGKGHGVHSPFVFDFIQNVLTDKRQFYAYTHIEEVRKAMITDERVLTIQDFGAGSTVMKGNQRKVNAIARSSLKPAKFGQLLFRIVNNYRPANIIELGTSLGITTAYMASPNQQNQVFTFEGANEVAAIARENFASLQLPNIQVVEGNFDNTLHEFLNQREIINLAFVDGNHRKQPTLNYFNRLLKRSNEYTIMIFDDIHWSKEMEEAWEEICNHEQVTLTIDLFFIGLVFFRKEQKKVQHFAIRF